MRSPTDTPISGSASTRILLGKPPRAMWSAGMLLVIYSSWFPHYSFRFFCPPALLGPPHPAGRSRGTLLRHAGTTCHGGVNQTKWPPTNPERFSALLRCRPSRQSAWQRILWGTISRQTDRLPRCKRDKMKPRWRTGSQANASKRPSVRRRPHHSKGPKDRRGQASF